MNMLNLCLKQHNAKANSSCVLLFKSIVIDTYLQFAKYIILWANVNMSGIKPEDQTKSDKMLHLADTILWSRDMDCYKISVV